MLLNLKPEIFLNGAKSADTKNKQKLITHHRNRLKIKLGFLNFIRRQKSLDFAKFIDGLGS